MNNSRPRCIVCGGELGREVTSTREMMFGLGDEFEYLQCETCDSLQITEVPRDMGRYYPREYPAFRWNSLIVELLGELTQFTGILDQAVERLTGRSIAECVQPMALQALSLIPRISWLTRRVTPGPQLRVLDIGCGSGIHLKILRLAGYRRLLGIDPNLESHYSRAGLSLVRQDALSIKGEFDIIILNHSLEHMPNPREVLGRVGEVLSAEGICIIRTPVVPSYAWDKYRGNWAQLDAPRHIFIPSVKGLRVLSEACGMEIVLMEYVSDDFQLWGSEQIAAGIHLFAENSYARGRRKSSFTRANIREYRRMAARLNSESRGDEIVLCLRRSPHK